MKKVYGKIGNMRKEKDFVVYPFAEGATGLKVQSDNRIAYIDLATGKGIVSDGKNGHQGFIKLNPALGAKMYDIPENFMTQLRAFSSGNQLSACGAVTFIVPGSASTPKGSIFDKPKGSGSGSGSGSASTPLGSGSDK